MTHRTYILLATSLLLLASIHFPAGAIERGCVVAGFASSSTIDWSKNDTEVLEAHRWTKRSDCSQARVTGGEVCLMAPSCNRRGIGASLVEGHPAEQSSFVAVVALLQGQVATSGGFIRDHQDASTLPAFPYSKVLAPENGSLIIPLAPSGGSASNFVISLEGRPLISIPNSTGVIKVNVQSLERNLNHDWSVVINGRAYRGTFYVIPEKRSQELREKIAEEVNREPDGGAKAVTEAMALYKRGLNLDAVNVLLNNQH